MKSRNFSIRLRRVRGASAWSASYPNGQVTPEGEWYDQDLDEWVVVLEGEARLHYMDGEEVGLKKGDSLFLPKRRKHRVVYTSSPCIWLAIHADLLTPQSVVADAI